MHKSFAGDEFVVVFLVFIVRLVLKPLILYLDSTGGKATGRTRTTDDAASSGRRIISPTARSSFRETKRRRHDAAGNVLVTVFMMQQVMCL